MRYGKTKFTLAARESLSVPDDARIESNNIAPVQAGEGTDGIVLAPGFDKTGLDRCQILGNRIIAMPGNGIHIAGAIVRSAMIKNNFIQVIGGGGIVMEDKSSALHLTIENNQLLNIAPLTNDENTAVVGLRVVNTARAEILTNVISDVGAVATQNPSRAAIQLANVESARVNGNQVINVGPAGDFLNDTIGIECLAPFSRLDINDNVVRRNDTPPDKLSASRWFAIRIGTLFDRGFARAGANLAFFAAGELIYVFTGNRLTVLPRGKEIVGLHGNLLEGYGAAPVILVEADGALTLSTNRCVLNAARVPVAEAQAGAIIASANYLEGSGGVPSMRLQLSPENGPFTVVGNITSGEIVINGTALPAPWASLNVVSS